MIPKSPLPDRMSYKDFIMLLTGFLLFYICSIP